MSDLISRQDAIDALDQYRKKSGMSELLHWNAVKHVLSHVPSAEPERKKGKWIDGLPYINSHWWVCSVCHVSAPENHTGYNFCPNCGAEMARGGR